MRGLKVFLFIGFFFMAIFGLLTLFMPAKVAEWKMGPADAVSARYSAVMMLALALAIWYAFRDPKKNTAIIITAIFGFGLSALLGLIHAITGAEPLAQALFGVVFGGVLAIGIAFLFPKGNKSS
ncbi:MAG: hypothetical protein HW414_1656 [Dehalococcoidia bacterium]|nr:hypothetical protein [Dehalococcoidia bacterium]